MKFRILTAVLTSLLATLPAYAKTLDEEPAKSTHPKAHTKPLARSHKNVGRKTDLKHHKMRQLKRVGFSLQSGGFTDLSAIEKVISTLKKDGKEAFYYRGKDGSYIIRIGDFRTRRVAIVTGNKLKSKKLILSYSIVRPSEIVSVPSANIGKQVAKHTATDRHNTSIGQERPAITVTPKSLKPSKSSKHWWEVNQPTPINGMDNNTLANNLLDRKLGDGRTSNSYSESTKSQKDPDASGMGVIAARTAERFVGIPYLWGGNNVVDGLDCSGFVRAVYNLCGYTLPRVAREQYQFGEVVKLEQIKEGDLIFFGPSPANIKHVGMYVGGGQFVHAPKRGEVIKITPITDENYAPRMMGVRRFF